MATASARTQDKLTGTVKHLTYVNDETGYFVARVEIQGKGETTVTGVAPVIRPGEQIEAHGAWTNSNWGRQFKANEVLLSQPTMLEGIEKYLANSVEGIGKGYAKKLVQAFGEDVFNVIENEPARLSAVKGVGPKRAESIIQAYKSNQAARDIMVFLHKVGLSSARAMKVHKAFGDEAIARIKENPYILCKDIWGIGFSTADAVAHRQGVSPQSEYRVRAGIQHILREALGLGNCALPVPDVLDKVSALLSVDYNLIERCIELELAAGALVRDTIKGQACLFTPAVYAAEQNLARSIVELAKRVPARPIANLDARINDAEVELGITLGDSQREAARIVLSSSVAVLTGGPGTGKTTITQLILKVLEESGDREYGGPGVRPNIVLGAPTGKAAKRASEATGRPAATVHRVLEFTKDGTFKHNAKNPLEGDIFGADEFSMADVFLANSYFQAIPKHGRLLIVGDVDQLESVGPGKVLADLIESGVVPVARLVDVYRQAAKSDIIKSAHAINRGEMPRMGYVEGSDFCFNVMEPKNKDSDEEKTKTRMAIQTEIVRVCRDMYKLGYDPIREVQVLSPMRKGALGVEALNVLLQAALNPTPEDILESWGTKWCVGDKVMQLRNNYDKEVFNGDVGYVHGVDKESKTIAVEYPEKIVEYATSELDELTLAYAMSIHRSQGSEFPAVVMPVDTAHWMMLKRNLFYTGLTRAKKLFVGFGSRMAVRQAVETVSSDARHTKLCEWLRSMSKATSFS